MTENNELRISSTSEPAKVGGAIAALMKEQYKTVGNKAQIELKSLGAGALNQAIKSVIVARGYLAPMGMNLYCIPAFGETEPKENEESRTLIRLILRTEV